MVAAPHRMAERAVAVAAFPVVAAAFQVAAFVEGRETFRRRMPNASSANSLDAARPLASRVAWCVHPQRSAPSYSAPSLSGDRLLDSRACARA